MGVANYGTGAQPLSNPDHASWAAAVAAVLNNSDTTVDARITAATSPDVRFTIDAGTGDQNAFQTVGSGSFTVVAQGTGANGSIDVNVGGGTWSGATAYTYTVPVSGLYLITANIRVTDSHADRNVFQGVHTATVDNPFGFWAKIGGAVGGSRWTFPYYRLGSFTQGDLLRHFVYSDGGTLGLNSAAMSIALLRKA